MVMDFATQVSLNVEMQDVLLDNQGIFSPILATAACLAYSTLLKPSLMELPQWIHRITTN